MTDLSLDAFRNPDFVAKEWINAIFQSTESVEDKEAFATSIVMKLQLSIQEINRSLEETSVQVIGSLPRIVREMESLQQEASILSSQMETMKEEVSKTYTDSADSMADLVALDRLKVRLNDTCAAVKQADNWTTLLADVEEVFDAGDITSIAAKLEALANSLSMLAHVPDYASRSQHLEALRNRLEALASPKLVAAFNATSALAAKDHYKLFISMGRESQFLKYFQNFHKGVLMQEWRNIVESEVDESYLEWQDKFYETLTRYWKEQRDWLGGINVAFDCDSALLQLFADVIDSLDPSLDFCLDASLKQRTDPLGYLESVMKSSNQFLCNIQNRQQSRNCEVSENFVATVYRPLRKSISNYTQYLNNAFEKAVFQQKDEETGDVLDRVNNLRKQCSKVADLVESSHEKCVELSHGCCIVMWLECVRIASTKLKTAVLRFLREVHEPADEWLLVQYALQTMEMTGELLYSLMKIDAKITQRSLEATKGLQKPASWQNYTTYLLTSESKASLMKFVQDLQFGERTSLIAGEIANALEDTGKEVRRWALDMLLHPVHMQLGGLNEKKLVPMDVQVATLPEFSFSPQEYITQVGQFIMTLPQHLESATSMNEKYLWAVLSLPDSTYCPEGFNLANPEREDPSAYILACLGVGACQIYAEECLKLNQVSSNAAKQLAADIEYFGNVLDDIGVQMHANLKALVHLLRLKPDEFLEKSAGHPHRVIAAVRHMRGIATKA